MLAINPDYPVFAYNGMQGFMVNQMNMNIGAINMHMMANGANILGNRFLATFDITNVDPSIFNLFLEYL